jgi:DNA helicase-2/ATP-dependent DNA helicase PcrA
VQAGADRVLAALARVAVGHRPEPGLRVPVGDTVPGDPHADPTVVAGGVVETTVDDSQGADIAVRDNDIAATDANFAVGDSVIVAAEAEFDDFAVGDSVIVAADQLGEPEPNGFDLFGWAADVTTLLAERATGEQHGPIEVDLPATLSVSALVELADDPQQLALRLRRPVPLEPAPHLRRGTAFHQWLERFFRGEALLDVRDLPGAGDVMVADDAEFEELRTQFLASPWANRVPVEIEVPFATRIAGVGVRGRIDAVFADSDGGLTVVDWKTGRPPARSRRPALGVQLACYRLAIAELRRVPLSRVRAAFHYIPTGVTIAPVDLLDGQGIGDMIAAALGDDQPAAR